MEETTHLNPTLQQQGGEMATTVPDLEVAPTIANRGLNRQEASDIKERSNERKGRRD